MSNSLLLHKRGNESKARAQPWECPSVFLNDVNSNYSKPKVDQKQPCSFMHYLAVTHWDAHTRRGTHLTHYLDVRDPLRSSFGPLVRQDRQDKVSGLGQRLPDQEGIRLVSRHEQLLCVGPRQVTVVPPDTQEVLMVRDAASVTRTLF